MTINDGNDLLLAEMKKKREFVKSQLRVHLDYASQFDPAEDTVENLESRIEMLEEILLDFKKIHGQIEDCVGVESEDEVLEVTKAYSSFTNEYCKVKGLIKKKISENKKTLNTESNAPVITKLPPVPIPNFSGNVKDWVSFRDTFQAIVINQKISNVVKFHYLRESLKSGEAWNLISEMTPSENTFKIAWETIEKRYDNKNIIVDSHVSELFKMRSIPSENAKDLWKLVENFGTHLKALESLGEPIEHWNTLIIHMIKFRLDCVSKNLWETKTVSMKDRPTWKDMESFLMERGRVLENLESTKRRSAPINSTGQTEKSTSSFVANLSSSYKCSYCSDSHKIAECRKFATLTFSEKQELIRKRGLCLKCLVRGHIAANCESSCEICAGNHHKAIHIERSKKFERQKTKIQQTLTNIAVTDEVILMTAKINVLNKDGSWIEARALLDSGSQSNFVTEKLLRKLNIDTKPTNTSVNGIGGVSGKLNQKVSTEIKSRCSEYQKSIELLVTPNIVERTPISKINVVSSSIPGRVLQRIADNSFGEPKEIDLLLGVEVFLEILQMEQVKAGGLTFQNSRFGWIAGGRCQKNADFKIAKIC